MNNATLLSSHLLPFNLSSSVLFSLISLLSLRLILCHVISFHFKSFLIIIFHSTIYPFIYIILIFMSLSFDVCEGDHVHSSYPNNSISNNFKRCWNLLVSKIVFIIFVFLECFSASISIQFNETIHFPPVPNYFIFLISSCHFISFHVMSFHFISIMSSCVMTFVRIRYIYYVCTLHFLYLLFLSTPHSLYLITLPCSITLLSTLLSSIYTHSQHTPHTLSTPPLTTVLKER